MAATITPAFAQPVDIHDDVETLVRQRRAVEALYRSMPPDRWHFQIDTNAGHGLMFANCERLSCGAFYRMPPVRLIILSMLGHPLRLRVTREDCLSADETWRSSSRLSQVRDLPISMDDLRSTAIALIRTSNAAALRNCGARTKGPASTMIRSLPDLRRRFTFVDDRTHDRRIQPATRSRR